MKEKAGKLFSSNLFRLFITFLKIGAFTFGGGYAMIALLENEFVSKKGWVDKDEFLDIVAIAESTPGPIAINSATYIGYKISGFFGSLVSTIAICLPSFVIIYIISLFFDRFLSLTYVEYAFRGIQICVIYLIASAGIKMFKGLKKSFFTVFIFCTVALVFVLFSILAINFSSIFYILICGVLGLFVYLLERIKKGRKGGESEGKL